AALLTRRMSLRKRIRIRDAEAVVIHSQLALITGRVIALQCLPLDAPGKDSSALTEVCRLTTNTQIQCRREYLNIDLTRRPLKLFPLARMVHVPNWAHRT